VGCNDGLALDTRGAECLWAAIQVRGANQHEGPGQPEPLSHLSARASARATTSLVFRSLTVSSFFSSSKLKRPIAAHHPPPRVVAEDDRQRVGGRVQAVVGRRRAGMAAST
jgi:hypothetical protein